MFTTFKDRLSDCRLYSLTIKILCQQALDRREQKVRRNNNVPKGAGLNDTLSVFPSATFGKSLSQQSNLVSVHCTTQIRRIMSFDIYFRSMMSNIYCSHFVSGVLLQFDTLISLMTDGMTKANRYRNGSAHFSCFIIIRLHGFWHENRRQHRLFAIHSHFYNYSISV